MEPEAMDQPTDREMACLQDRLEAEAATHEVKARWAHVDDEAAATCVTKGWLTAVTGDGHTVYRLTVVGRDIAQSLSAPSGQ